MYHIHQKVLLKLGSFSSNGIYCILTAKFTSNKPRRKVKDCLRMQRDILQHSRLPKEEIFLLVRNRDLWVFLYFLANTNNASEGVFLIPISLLSLLFFIVWLGMMSFIMTMRNNILAFVQSKKYNNF